VAKLKLSTRVDVEREPIITARFAIALVLMALGVAWIVYYYVGVHPGNHQFSYPNVSDYHGLTPLRHLKDWNYLIGFGLFFIGLIVSANPDTPLGRNQGVVVAMLACFIIGLVWICVFYIFSGNDNIWFHIPVFNDLNQKNLLVGIAWMAVGFAFATRWQ
jgi:hypothetical protein